ncbi:MAG: hypothetical protein ACFFCW_29240 [Candidatus Hodarchaeota archaeon]
MLVWLLVFGRELPTTVFTEPYLPDSHQLRLPKALFLAAMAAAVRADWRSSSWHDYHLYGTFGRLSYIKVSIYKVVSDTLRIRYE